MHRPQLLFVAPWFLFPIDAGGKIRTTDILRGMKGGRFRIRLVSPQSTDGKPHLEELETVCDEFVGWHARPRGPLFPLTRMRHLLSSLPIPVATDRSAVAQLTIGRELKRTPDVVVVDFLHSHVLMPRRLGAPSVLFTHNVEAEIFARHAEVAGSAFTRRIWAGQAAKMARFESDTIKRYDRVVAVSERDAEAFREHLEPDRLAVIPTGVNLDFYDYCEPGTGDPAPGESPADVVFTASMNSYANIDGIEAFLGEVWPLVREARPQATGVAVGRNPPQHLVDKGRAAGFRFTGFVDDVRPYVHGAGVYVIPLRVGGGTRLKVFEAMAMGAPVVSTGLGVEGLEVAPDKHYLRVVELGRRLSRAARAHVEAHFSSKAVAQRFEAICAEAAGLD